MCASHSGVLPSSQETHHSAQWCRAMRQLQGKDGDANGTSEAKPAADPELEAARKAERERRAAKVSSPWLTSSTLLLRVNDADGKAQSGHRRFLLQTHKCSLVPIIRKGHGSLRPLDAPAMRRRQHRRSHRLQQHWRAASTTSSGPQLCVR